MIAVDASAVLAILFREPEGAAFEEFLLRNGGGVISPVNYWEVMVRARAAGSAGVQIAESILNRLGVETVSMTPIQARLAVDAHQTFGRGTPARLNLGDCFAYALAATEGDGLLFKGDDFPRTDVKAALPPSPR